SVPLRAATSAPGNLCSVVPPLASTITTAASWPSSATQTSVSPSGVQAGASSGTCHICSPVLGSTACRPPAVARTRWPPSSQRPGERPVSTWAVQSVAGGRACRGPPCGESAAPAITSSTARGTTGQGEVRHPGHDAARAGRAGVVVVANRALRDHHRTLAELRRSEVGLHQLQVALSHGGHGLVPGGVPDLLVEDLHLHVPGVPGLGDPGGD